MTVEQTTSIAIDDLERIVFVCANKKCSTSVIVTFKSGMEPVWACPACGENWFRDNRERVPAFNNLVKSLMEFQRKDLPLEIRFLIKKSPSSASDTSTVS